MNEYQDSCQQGSPGRQLNFRDKTKVPRTKPRYFCKRRASSLWFNSIKVGRPAARAVERRACRKKLRHDQRAQLSFGRS